MGVKLTLLKKDLKGIIDVDSIKSTSDGITDSVFILDDRYILKIFHNSTKKEVSNEIKLLKSLSTLKVSKVYDKIFKIKGKYALLYKRSSGKSLKKIKKKHIKQIAKFLKKLHKTTKNKTSQNQQIFTKSYLKKLIKKTKNKELLKLYKKMAFRQNNDGIIHGDIFLDNVLFKKDKISAVIDFSQACNGDFLFDLAVVALVWCKSAKDRKLLIKYYNKDIKYKILKRYISYVALYYTTTRYLFGTKQYKEYMKYI